MSQFIKPAKSNSELVQQWKERGLIIPDETRAERYLEHISYYRFSAYTIPFQQLGNTSHQFKPDTKFNDILNLYIFDRELRLIVLDAIERIEVSIRTKINNEMSIQSQNPFWYIKEDYFQNNFNLYRLLANIEKQLTDEQQRLERDEKHILKRYKNNNIDDKERDRLLNNVRKENFLRHYLTQYNTPKLLPSWMMIEMLTWGELSHLYSGLLEKYQKPIAQHFGVQAPILESWLKVLNDVRNICAHHSRLWNREFGRIIKIPISKNTQWLSSAISLNNTNINADKRLYPILVAIQVMLYEISPNSTWIKRLKELLDNYPQIQKEYMGIPQNWELDSFWDKALR
ncbi:Abi-like protein [Mannheimia sp. USDA-ARS-USMARC-1261]|uniref:Abi family protein n=1 Tax=Mannheimia sp. USDA-ARS-USMARC-1261 TaxID=1432056 RepID=UPI0003E3AC12|nr:Abi family protein [Mannheimia sp. USDA-ARS-USMARC-1261]AHG72200.1 Abi-like protein [Mannheimia sp. USDA-ARS-USMARC-1261]